MPPFSNPTTLQANKWTLPVLRLAGFRIEVSYGILISAAALAVFAATVAKSGGNADMPRVVALGTLFWMSGWLVQVAAYLGSSRLIGSPASALCLGVLGVEVGPRRWPVRHALLTALSAIASLIALGSFYRLIEGGFRIPQIIPSETSAWSAPSLGFSKHDAIWHSAAWLCWAQTLLQLYPLPRTLGRQIVGALAAASSRNLDLAHQVAIFRRCLVAVSLLTVGITIGSVMTGTSFFGVHWIAFLVLSLMLWISSQGTDLSLILTGLFTDAGAELRNQQESRGSRGPLGVGLEIRDMLRRRRRRRKLRRAQQLERGEAIDVQRVDEILSRLHQEGIDSLSSEDRRILDRVSERLRRRRTEGLVEEPPED